MKSAPRKEDPMDHEHRQVIIERARRDRAEAIAGLAAAAAAALRSQLLKLRQALTLRRRELRRS
jgi:hypothetical protein